MAAGENKRTGTFPVTGMGCAACAARIGKVLGGHKGVYEANVNFAASNVKITYDPGICSPEEMREAVREAGYDMITGDGSEDEDEAESAGEKEWSRLKAETACAIALTVPVMALSMFFADLPYSGYIQAALSAAVLSFTGKKFYTNAWKQLRHMSAGMDTLVAASTSVAYLYSLCNLLFPQFLTSRGIEPHIYFESASGIIALILLGRLLEARARKKTSAAIRGLMELQPKTVTVLRNRREASVPARDIRKGDIIIVRPGDRIAADGTVTSGESYVDESMMTGEPVPVFRKEGDTVMAGSVNSKGTLTVRADKTGKDTVLAGIIRMVREAQGSRIPIQQMTDRIASVFVPVIAAVALLSFILWWVLGPENGFAMGVMSMVTVLTIACPCALGLATPTALIAGIGKGASEGILIRDGAALEIAGKTDCMIMDKTGTLTEGRPSADSVMWLHENGTEADILFSLESLSGHPVAEAVAAHLRDSCKTTEITGFEDIPGKGVRGCAGGKSYFAGSRAFLEEYGIRTDNSLSGQASQWMEKGATVVWFADQDEAIAVFSISDRIRPEAAGAVGSLKEMGIEVYMLTGDNEVSAGAVASATGIRHYRAGMLPEDKAAFVRELQAKGHVVAMTGDGINDSAALACADLSIAMGKGSDIAMDTAMVTILTSDLGRLPDAVRLSRVTVRTIRKNLFWAFFYNVAAVPVAAGVLYPVCGFLLDPMIAAGAMALSSISVVLNSLRLACRGKM